MSTTWSTAGARSAVRLLVTLLALLLAETLLASPRRVGSTVPQASSVEASSSAGTAPGAGLAGAAAAGDLPGGTVAVATADLGARGRVTAPPELSGPEALRPFPTASLVKLYLAQDVLHRARAGLLVLDEADRAGLRAMITSSDDAAASALWVRFDGDRVVRDVSARFGLSGTAPPPVAGQWGRAVTTARDVATFFARLPVLAHPEDAAALLGWMAEVTPLAADGYDQRFGVLAVPGDVAAKQGWMCCVDGLRHLHSVGVRDGRVVVLLSDAPVAVPDAAVRARLDAVAAALPPPGPTSDRC